MPVATDELLTRRQAAKYLNLKPQTLASWAMDARNIPFVKLGKAVRYRRTDLDKYIERQTVPASV